jgi:tRNA threonylcarbamoyladenosine biosynthesis protein TsaB
MPLVLAAETSTAINSVAILRDDALLAEAVIDGRRLHSERLLPTVDWLLGEAGLTLRDIELLAVATGPGSFTGLRIGAATWKGLALANDLPLVAVPTLDAMTRLCPCAPASHLAVVLDARMKEVFAAVYRFEGGRRIKVIQDQACSIDALLDQIVALDGLSGAPLSLMGDGADLYRESILSRWPGAAIAAPAQGSPRASAVGLEALALQAAGVSTDAAGVSPVYLRKSQAEINRDLKLAQSAT